MKRILTLLFLIGAYLSVISQTTIVVSGKISDIKTHWGVEHVRVVIESDSASSWNYYHVDYTDTFGDYSFTIIIPSTVTTASFNIFIKDCNNRKVNKTVYFPDSAQYYVKNFTICSGLPTNCTAKYNYYQDSMNLLKFQFNSLNTGVKYLWSFGDNTTSTLKNPLHTYAKHGIYHVSYAVTDTIMNCTDTKLFIIETNPNACNAKYTTVLDSINTMKITFIGSQNSSTANYTWDFGDKSTYGSGQTVAHTFQSIGLFDVTLYVLDTIKGCLDEFTDNFYLPTDTGCISLFQYHSAYLKTSFWSDSTQFSNPTFSWDFGDSTTKTTSQEYITHTYEKAGTYQVCHIVSSNNQVCVKYCQNVTVTKEPPVTHGYIHGMVYTGSIWADYATVYLIKHDSANGTLTAIDTFNVDSGGVYGFYAPLGNYLIKVALRKNSKVYKDYLPTYYDTVLFWNKATTVGVSIKNRYNYANINMIKGTNPGGPGFIGGKISNGARANEDGIPDILVLLLDSYDVPVAFTYSDAAGEFEFKNLALGSYKVHVEITGIEGEFISTEINTESPSSSGSRFWVNDDGITTGFVEDISMKIKSIGQPYPNPVSSDLNLNVELLEPTLLSFVIVDQLGKKVLAKDFELNSGFHQLSFDSEKLEPGMYYLVIKSNDDVQLNRKFIKAK